MNVMKKISCDRYPHKTEDLFFIIVPSFFIVVFVYEIFNNNINKEDAFFCGALLGIFILGIINYKTNPVDEVYDCGSYLLVLKKGQEEKILLSDIKNIRILPISRNPQTKLTLNKPCIFGKIITFSPDCSFFQNPLKKPPLIQDLIDRVNQAKGNVR